MLLLLPLLTDLLSSYTEQAFLLFGYAIYVNIQPQFDSTRSTHNAPSTYKSILGAHTLVLSSAHTHLCILWILCVIFLYIRFIFFDCFLGRAKKCYTLTVVLMKYVVLSTHYSSPSRTCRCRLYRGDSCVYVYMHVYVCKCVMCIHIFFQRSYVVFFSSMFTGCSCRSYFFSTLLLFKWQKFKCARAHIHYAMLMCVRAFVFVLANCMNRKNREHFFFKIERTNCT